MRMTAAYSTSFLFSLAVSACVFLTESAPPNENSANVLVTDSTEFGARLVGNAYVGNVQYTFTNPARLTVSRNYCGSPPPPDLQKNIEGSWVSLFPVPQLLCLTIPP